jgi:hypothetical protein
MANIILAEFDPTAHPGLWRHTATSSLSPPPPTQPHAPSKIQAKSSKLTTQQGKIIVNKKTPIDRFNDNRQSEAECLTFKRKMEHDERMASISLEKRKYELRFASTPTHGLGSPTPSESAEDKQIQILQL